MKNRRLRVCVAMLAAAAALSTAPTAAVAADSPAASVTAYMIDTTVGGQPAMGTQSFVAYAPTASGYAVSGGMAIQATVGSYSRTFLIAPTGGRLDVGTYDTATSPDPTHAELSTSFPSGASCGTQSGTVTIHEVTRDGSDNITGLAATAETTCDGGASWVGLEIRWSSSVDVVRLSAPVGSTTPTQSVTFTATAPTTFGQAAVEGADSNGPSIVSDTCSNAVLDTGETCQIDVDAFADNRGWAQATLTLPDGTPEGRVVPIVVVGTETAAGGYTALSPARILDTRAAIGVSTKAPLGAGKTLNLQITSRGGVPASGVAAVVFNLTVVKPTTAGFLTAYPAGQARPTASSINFVRGWVGANLVTVPVGTGGKVAIYNPYGSTGVVADVVGFYRSAASTPTMDGSYGSYDPVAPQRLVDTRSADWGNERVPNGWAITGGVDYGAENNAHIRAVALNITAVAPAAAGFLSAWNGDPDNLPTTSSVNYVKGKNVPNMAIVPTQQVWDPVTSQYYPYFGVYNKGGPVHVIIDIVGVYDDNSFDQALRFRSITPTRIVDTRSNLGTGPLAGGVARTVTAPAFLTDDDTWALVTNTTAVKPTRNCVLTLWASDGSPRPLVSNLNPYAGQVVANMTITGLGDTFGFEMYNNYGLTDAVVDVSGAMELYPASAPQPGLRHGAAVGSRLGFAGHPGAAVLGAVHRVG